MKKTIKNFILALTLSIGVLSPLALTQSASAVNPVQDACANSGSASSLCQNTAGNSVSSVVGIIVNVLLFVVGIISVIMIIISGLKYATSNGDTGNVTSAKNTLLYAVVGLIVAFVAFAIVNWVLKLF